MIRILFVIFFLFSFHANTQLNISIEGYVNNFSSKKVLYGASLYLFQNGTMISKSLTDVKGDYYISGKIDTKVTFDLLISKPGYVTKKVLLDFEDLKVQNPNGIMQAMEELVIELFENRNGVDLSFVKNKYAEKFNWDASRNIAVPEDKYKKDIEEEVLKAYEKAAEVSKSELFIDKMNASLMKNKYEEALISVDSALHYNSTDKFLNDKKKEIEALIDQRNKGLEKRKEFDELKIQGDLAYSSGDLFGAEGFYNDALAIYSDNQIKYKLTKIAEYKTKISKLDANEEKLNTLRKQSDSLISIGKFRDGIIKLREIQYMDPNQRLAIQSEIKAIEKEANNVLYEAKINEYLKIAIRLEKSKDSLDASLFFYQKAEKGITNLTDQNLIRSLSDQVKNGIESITKKKYQEKEAFYQQLEKANENFMKGPDFYEKAIKVLDSPLMKEYANAPEIKKLKKKIGGMTKFYELKKNAFLKFNTNRGEAVSGLKKALTIGNEYYAVTPKKDINEIRDSLRSWTGGTNFVVKTNNTVITASNSPGSVVRSPGERHNGSDIDAFNDLNYTIAQRKSQPLGDLQKVKNEIDYELFFDQTVESVRSEKSSDDMKVYMDQLEMNSQFDANHKIELQNKQAESRQKLEFEVKDRNDYALKQQEESAMQVQDWVDNRDYLAELELLTQYRRNQAFDEMSKKQENERILIASLNDEDNEQRQYNSQKTVMQVNYEQFLRDSIAKQGGEDRSIQIESLKSNKPFYPTQPNFLKDEDGNLFPSNALTERIFKNKNSNGLVTSVVVQRVVVDMNGYGVVYEKTTNEGGDSYYTRNSAAITEFNWFHESSGKDVIQK